MTTPIFKKREDLFCLAIVFLFTILSLHQIYAGYRVSPEAKLYLSFLTYIVFGSALHIPFTFAMLVALPECRAWFREQSAKAAMDKKVYFVFTCFFLGQAYFLFLHDFKGPNANSPAIILVRIFWYVLPIYHAFRQLQGIAKMIDKPKPIGRWAISEDTIFNVLSGLIFVHGIVFMSYLHRQMPFHIYHPIRMGIILAFLALSLPLFINGSRTRNLYLLRIVLFPLSFASFMAWVGSGILHGIEYFFITKRILGNSQAKANFAFFFKSSLSVIILIYGLTAFLLNGHYGVLALITGGKGIDAAWYHFFHLSSLSIAFCHHYFDGVLFRMKDPITRKYIGPLLGGARAAQSESTEVPKVA